MGPCGTCYQWPKIQTYLVGVFVVHVTSDQWPKIQTYLGGILVIDYQWPKIQTYLGGVLVVVVYITSGQR